MQYVAVEPAWLQARREYNAFVHRMHVPVGIPFVKKAHLIVGIPAAVPYWLAAEKVKARY